MTAFLTMVVALGTLMVAGEGAEAKKPGTTAQAATLSLNQSDPKLGDVVTFSYTVSATVNNPRIQVICSQNGSPVYVQAEPAANAFVLGGMSSQWLTNGAAANCVATLYEWDFKPVQTMNQFATISFSAAGR